MIQKILNKMIQYDANDAPRIQHLLKVCGFAHMIGELEGVTAEDFLVNAFEEEMGKEEILSVREKVFKTRTGIDTLNTMFGL